MKLPAAGREVSKRNPPKFSSLQQDFDAEFGMEFDDSTEPVKSEAHSKASVDIAEFERSLEGFSRVAAGYLNEGA